MLRVLGLLEHVILGIGLGQLGGGRSDYGSAQQRILVELDLGVFLINTRHFAELFD